jgi:hypothetical protein
MSNFDKVELKKCFFLQTPTEQSLEALGKQSCDLD